MAYISDDEKQLYSRVEDTIRLCSKRNTPCFLGFLDQREQALIVRRASVFGDVKWHLFGGYEGAERAVLAVFPDFFQEEYLEFPFGAVAFHYRKAQKLTHRDFLGTLMAAGVRRDTIGDILCGEGLTVVFLSNEIVPYICENVKQVGGEGVSITPHYSGEFPISHEYLDIKDTVASPRLDSVVKSLLHISRDEAAQLVRGGLVSVDHLPAETISRNLSAPCTVSVRGHGRFIIDGFGPETKKGRLQFRARKCI